jgi:hypothetical protein
LRVARCPRARARVVRTASVRIAKASISAAAMRLSITRSRIGAVLTSLSVITLALSVIALGSACFVRIVPISRIARIVLLLRAVCCLACTARTARTACTTCTACSPCVAATRIRLLAARACTFRGRSAGHRARPCEIGELIMPAKLAMKMPAATDTLRDSTAPVPAIATRVVHALRTFGLSPCCS